ncbi:hypothetical protein FRC04_012156 [Tulasnella sp. 424]|nr:hypothetical protein FRC04_012156 [Tulasnella sp. 424]KAG8971036.1 hypothetical protein FRC05_011502 [Tulasnella sp. 425]
MPTLVVSSSNVLLKGRKKPQAATFEVNLNTGKIDAVHEGKRDKSEYYASTPDELWIDAGDLAHVHLNEPGRTDWEGFMTGTQAAISGGVTTVVDMPLNSIPPTTTVDSLETKRKAARGQCWTDVGFWGGIIPGNDKDLPQLVKQGVKGFKCFLIESGVDEFPCVAEDDLVQAMVSLDDSPTTVLYHAELEGKGDAAKERMDSVSDKDPASYSTFLASRPPSLELDAIELVISLHRRFSNLRGHVVHLSAAEALPVLRQAKAAGVNLTVETCFHYLCLNAEQIPHGHPEFKCCPPIRDNSNRQLLWEGLLDGTIDFVVSDHSPCVASLKRVEEDGDFMKAWGGVSTLGLGLSLLWTEATNNRKDVSIGDIIEWTSAKTAKHASLEGVKGAIEVGYDGDFVIWDPEAEFLVTKGLLKFKNKLSPYEGLRLRGVVNKSYVRGTLGYNRLTGGFVGLTAPGQLL